MELQGKKVTHDFLSLYPSDSSFQFQDPRSSSQGFYLKTRDFLQPLERGEKGGAHSGEAVAVDDGNIPTDRPVERGVSGAGACSISHVGDAGTKAAAGLSKPETTAVRTGFPVGLEAKPEPDYGSRSTTTSYGSYAGATSYTVWDDKDTACRGQWPSPLSAGRGGGCSGSISASARRNNSAPPEKKRFMEAATSRSTRGYDEVDDEDEVFVKREGSSSRQDLPTDVDGKASSDQRPNTPRSKHSATEQRRRSKINDRFQILREIIPHSDQKRDKASFLLEVIEYIRFLQEKVQKFESSYSTWNQDNAKLTPWKSSQAPANGLTIPSQVVKTDPGPPAQLFSKASDESSIPILLPAMPNMHCSPATGVAAGSTYKRMETPITFASNLQAATHNMVQPRLLAVGKETSIDHSQQRLVPNQDNMAFQDRSPWLRSCSMAGSAVSRSMLNEQEELTIDDGTIRVSTAYSHGLLNALAQTLQRSGVDLSQADISVQINLGKRTKNQRATAEATTSTVKDPKDPPTYQAPYGYSILGSSIEQSQAPKRHKVENS
ncbi:transcription factor BIM1-like [Canna indica]|uniref:Transcription factor BIM1-like n=1 Tax=Canna indica TaxID=4628 RepID=A0AAQ3KNE6_9LILI|nr:transcription factor BIM1-like [Canna indica]